MMLPPTSDPAEAGCPTPGGALSRYRPLQASGAAGGWPTSPSALRCSSGIEAISGSEHKPVAMCQRNLETAVYDVVTEERRWSN